MSLECAFSAERPALPADRMRRFLRPLALCILLLAAGYVIAFHGVPSVVNAARDQIIVLQQQEPPAARRWLPPLVPGL